VTLVHTEALSKRYGRISALADCSFGIERGEILGLLGPNGAGKTTLLRLLMGYLKPTSGRATIDGLDCYRESVDVHRRLAYLPGEARLFRQLNGRQTLEFFCRLRESARLERALQLADRLQLDLARRVRQMSTGMRQKLALVLAMTPDVPLLILDEPTENLDPTVRRDVVELIRETREQGKTVFFSSHVLSEVEDVCDRVLVLRQGRIVDSVRVAEVRQQHRITAELTGPLTPPPAELAASLEITHGANQVVILTRGELAALLGWLAQQPLARLAIEPVGLRTVYERHHPAGTA
jgi:ABC-2 type transport system ATP-binding protein